MLADSKEWRQGRLGEILQFGVFQRLGVEMQDLADRTEKRAPLLHGRISAIISPDVNAIKSAKFFIEFKTKSHHQEWRGGSADDVPRIASRDEEGIDRKKWFQYRMAERRWRQPVVLSFLSIDDAEMIAATLEQLGEPRHSPNQSYDLVNWAVRSFSRIATFDKHRLRRFFRSEQPRDRIGQDRWLANMPLARDLDRMLSYLETSQGEFRDIRQFIFDQIERGWK